MDTLGFFQLENLILSRNIFPLVDLREGQTSELPPPLDEYLGHAYKIAPKEVVDQLSKLMPDKSRPVVLMSETEKPSVNAARDLEAAGFANVYIVAGGVEGLLSEL